MTDEALHGYLDHLRENLKTLDEQIENARVMSKEKDATALQWAKTLRDLLELRNVTLDKIKGHLLGRDETGAVEEPLNFHSSDNHPLTLFERQFSNFLSKPWTVHDLKAECSKCGTKNESTVTRTFERFYTTNDWSKYIQYDPQDLCDGCYDSTLQELHEVKEAREENAVKPRSSNSIVTDGGRPMLITFLLRKVRS